MNQSKKKLIITEEQFKNLLGYDPTDKGNYIFNPFRILEKDFDLIKEGLFKSYDIDFVVKHFSKYLRFADNYSVFAYNPSQYNGFITKVLNENNLYYIEMVVLDNEELLKKVEKTLNLCGYYLSFSEEYCNGYLQCGFEKKFEDIIDLNVDKIYHVTLRDNKLKIGRIGLVPKAKNKKTYHMERIYFFTKDYGEKGFLNIAEELYKGKTTFGYIVYEIDVNDLKDVKFHFDPNTEDAIYTTDNIPPSVLKIKFEYKK